MYISLSNVVAEVVSLRGRLFGPDCEPLRESVPFRPAFVDDFGAIAWPGGPDISADEFENRPETTARIGATS